ncbi:MAG: hypothetical protein ABMA64_15785 [Myxococcota bacterium]
MFATLFVGCTHPAPVERPAASSLVAQGDWQVASTEPYPGKQDDLVFVSPTVGFYGNGAGKVFRTDDGGDSWTQVMDQPGTFVRALGFLDADRGFVGNIGLDYYPGVTDGTLLYQTTDGGASWSPVTLPDADGARGVCAIDVLKLDFVNAGHRGVREIVHVGGRVGGPASLFASEDGGQTWARLPLPPEVAMILDVKFLDPSTGFVFAGTDPDVSLSNGLIVKTTDGGRTWRAVYRSGRVFELMWKASFPSRAVGYATLQNYSGEASKDPEAHVEAVPTHYVVKTEDGGETWTERPMVDDVTVQEFGVGFVDERHGWVGAIPTGFETTDGGATWTAAPTMAKATNKIRVVPTPTGAEVWGIGVDLRHLTLVPAAGEAR